MRLSHRSDLGRFVLHAAYEERHAAKSAGFAWDRARAMWWTADPAKAARFAHVADHGARRRVEEGMAERRAAMDASRASDAPLDVPLPPGLALYGYQRAGVAYALARRATLFGDEMGLGKSVMALVALRAADAYPAIVVCPASLKLNWRNEARRWTPDVTLIVLNGWLPQDEVGRAAAAIRALGAPAAKVGEGGTPRLLVVANYDILEDTAPPRRRGQQLPLPGTARGPATWWLDALTALRPEAVVFDEAHYCKNPEARRTKAALALARGRGRVLALTGTPLVNRPAELVGPLALLGVLDDDFGGAWKFKKRYCGARQEPVPIRGGTKMVWRFDGAANLGELQEKLRATCMVRRLKKDVLAELPPKVRQVIELPADLARAALDKERDVLARDAARLVELRAAVELAKASPDPADFRAAVEALRDGRRASFQTMAVVRHETALAKAPFVVAHLRDASGKVICFAHHRDVVDKIAGAFPGEAVVLTGETPNAARQAAVETFQADPQRRVFVGSIGAAGVGLTLTAASHVVFAELDWVPGALSQAEDRAHRVGQRDSVLVQHLVLEGSLDATMAKRVVEKQRVIDAALDDPTAATPMTPDDPPPPTTDAIGPDALTAEAAALSPGDVTGIHAALRRLAAACDGATSVDGAGFNKYDAAIGKSLASAPRLTPRQAALGARLVRRYRAQLQLASAGEWR